MDMAQVKNLINILCKMKDLRRRGWVNRHIKNPESDAGHSFSVALLTMLLAPKEIDLCKCLQMALVHDLPEVFCGDFVPNEIAPEEKQRLETEAMRQLVQQLNVPKMADLFAEFEAGQTPEARFVKAIDRVDNVLTAEYYRTTQGIDLVAEFIQSALPRVMRLDEKTQKSLLRILQDLSVAKSDKDIF
ncbi:MAG: HD domain-containing protein [Alphaproteobacteria bacterium]|nr:HD domain-containing protein [Alphaproteobacteria bacterium]